MYEEAHFLPGPAGHHDSVSHRAGDMHSILVSIEDLHLLAWIGFLTHKQIHEFLGFRFTLAITAALVTAYDISKRILLIAMDLDFLVAVAGLHFSMMEAFFICMLVVILGVKINSRGSSD